MGEIDRDCLIKPTNCKALRGAKKIEQRPSSFRVFCIYELWFSFTNCSRCGDRDQVHLAIQILPGLHVTAERLAAPYGLPWCTMTSHISSQSSPMGLELYTSLHTSFTSCSKFISWLRRWNILCQDCARTSKASRHRTNPWFQAWKMLQARACLRVLCLLRSIYRRRQSVLSPFNFSRWNLINPPSVVHGFNSLFPGSMYITAEGTQTKWSDAEGV